MAPRRGGTRRPRRSTTSASSTSRCAPPRAASTAPTQLWIEGMLMLRADHGDGSAAAPAGGQAAERGRRSTGTRRTSSDPAARYPGGSLGRAGSELTLALGLALWLQSRASPTRRWAGAGPRNASTELASTELASRNSRSRAAPPRPRPGAGSSARSCSPDRTRAAALLARLGAAPPPALPPARAALPALGRLPTRAQHSRACRAARAVARPRVPRPAPRACGARRAGRARASRPESWSAWSPTLDSETRPPLSSARSFSPCSPTGLCCCITGRATRTRGTAFAPRCGFPATPAVGRRPPPCPGSGAISSPTRPPRALLAPLADLASADGLARELWLHEEDVIQHPAFFEALCCGALEDVVDRPLLFLNSNLNFVSVLEQNPLYHDRLARVFDGDVFGRIARFLVRPSAAAARIEAAQRAFFRDRADVTPSGGWARGPGRAAGQRTFPNTRRGRGRGTLLVGVHLRAGMSSTSRTDARSTSAGAARSRTRRSPRFRRSWSGSGPRRCPRDAALRARRRLHRGRRPRAQRVRDAADSRDARRGRDDRRPGAGASGTRLSRRRRHGGRRRGHHRSRGATCSCARKTVSLFSALAAGLMDARLASVYLLPSRACSAPCPASRPAWPVRRGPRSA